MTYAKFGQEYLYDPAFLNLSRDARLFCFEATQWSAMTMTDGHVTPSTFRRFSDSPDPDAAVRELLGAELLEVAEAGYQLTRFTDEQMSAAQVQANKEKWKKDKKRSVKHKAGDHSMCTRGRYCPAGEIEPNYPSKVASTVEAPVESEVEAPVSASGAVAAAVAVATPRERKQEAAETADADGAESPGLRPAPRTTAPPKKEEAAPARQSQPPRVASRVDLGPVPELPAITVRTKVTATAPKVVDDLPPWEAA